MTENLLDELLAPALAEMDPTHPSPPAVEEIFPATTPKKDCSEWVEDMNLRDSIRFVGPKFVNSFIGFRATLHVYKDQKDNDVSATVVFGDCSRRIDWDLTGKDGVEKLDNAITMLEDVRAILKSQLDKRYEIRRG